MKPHLPGIMAHEMGHVAHNDGDAGRFPCAALLFRWSTGWGLIDKPPLPGQSGTTAWVSTAQTEDEKIFFRFQALKIKLLLAFWFGDWAFGLRPFMGALLATARLRQTTTHTVSARTTAWWLFLRYIDTSSVAQPILRPIALYTAERLDKARRANGRAALLGVD